MWLTYLVQIILLIQDSCSQKLSRIQTHLSKKNAFFLIGIFSLFFHIFKVQSQILFFRTHLPTQRQQGEFFGNSGKKPILCFLWSLRLPSHNYTFRIRYDAGQSTEPWKACNGNGECGQDTNYCQCRRSCCLPIWLSISNPSQFSYGTVGKLISEIRCC